jgi:hypothetical protein
LQEPDSRIGQIRLHRAGDVVGRAVVDDDRFPVAKALRLKQIERRGQELRDAVQERSPRSAGQAGRENYSSPVP